RRSFFPCDGSHLSPPTLTVSVPIFRSRFFHFCQTSKVTPGLPSSTCSWIVAESHLVGRPETRPRMGILLPSTSTTRTDTMSDAAVQTVRDVYAAFGRGDLPAVLAKCAE